MRSEREQWPRARSDEASRAGDKSSVGESRLGHAVALTLVVLAVACSSSEEEPDDGAGGSSGGFSGSAGGSVGGNSGSGGGSGGISARGGSAGAGGSSTGGGAQGGGAGADSGGAQGGGSGGTSDNLLQRRISAGLIHVCAITATGEARCWGDASPESDFGQMSAPAQSMRELSAGWYHTCGIEAVSTSLRCWGENRGGESTPPTGEYSQSSVNVFFGCAVAANGTLSCWGTPSLLPEGPGGAFQQVATGSEHVCGLRAGGGVECWGDDRYDQLAAPPDEFLYIDAGDFHTCGITRSGAVVCWGAGGPGDVDTSIVDEDRVHYGQSVPADGEFIHVDAGYRHTCAVRPNHAIDCWGAGTRDADCAALLDECGQSLPPAEADFLQVAAAASHSCGLTETGTVRCWGSNSGGRATPPAELAD